MNFNIIKLAAILLMLAGSFLSCKDKNEKQCTENECNVCDPLTDLPWMKEVIKKNFLEIPGYTFHKKIYQCTYKNGIGFVVEWCATTCDDVGSTLFSCDGEELCYICGFCNEYCNEWEIDTENMKLIFDNKKNIKH